MNGVEILNEYVVQTTQVWVYVVGILAAIGTIIFIVMFCHTEGDILPWISLACFFICLVVLFTLAITDSTTNYLKEYGHTEYKVTIDDSVSMNEFLDKYEIVDQEGKIYTVKERE